MLKLMNWFLILALIPLILSISLTPALSFAFVYDSPKHQMASGKALNQISCVSGKVLMVSMTGKPGCAFEDHVDELIQYGWGTIVENVSPVEIEEPQTGKSISVELEESVGLKGN